MVELIVGACAAVNLLLVLYNSAQLRRWRRLNDAWFELCLGAYRLRHWPHLLRELEREEAAFLARLRQAND